MPESPHSGLLPKTLHEALTNNSIVLAPSERAAGDLRARFNQSQLAAGLSAWEPARILSWNAWLNTLWSDLVTEGHDQRLLLNPAQEHILWREAINTGPEFESLGSLDSLADLAQNAWRLAASYEATADLRRFATTHDSRTFAAWAAAFSKRCERQHYLSAGELPAALREYLDRGFITAPPNLLLIAFDDDTPARTGLLTALASKGCDIQRLSSTEPAAFRAVVQAKTPQVEMETAAHYIRHFLETRLSSPLETSSLGAQQNTRVALIVPNLTEDRQALEATLRNILAPELQQISADISSTPYAFSSGTPLAETALAATALDILRWIAEPLSIDHASTLLLSPYIGAFAEIEERAAFDAFKLRQTPMLRPEVDIAAVARLSAAYPSVTHLLTPLSTRAARLTATHRGYADWMEFFRDTLRDANFPGDRPLTAQEFRDARIWDHVLDNVATLDFTGPRVDYATALAALQRQARAATSAYGNNDAAVQIMTPAEAAGSSFDAIIFLHATDTNWPASERANPLLGWSLQHDRQMPGTDPARTATRAEAATQRLTDAAPDVLFFYAAEDENGPQRLSPIIERLGWDHIDAGELLTPPAAPAPIAVEEIEDAAQLPPLFSPNIRGGALVLKLQASCGFRAFAEVRLNANAPESSSPGFDARQTGNLVHEIMEHFWRTVQTQDTLRSMSQAERTNALQTAIDKSFAHTPAPETSWDDAYLSVQKDRMRNILLQWLQLELQRSPFTVTEREQKQTVNVGPLTLQLRMDRVDAVDGGTLLVDYKTGSRSTPKDWEGPRPDDPQLPLYALLPEAENLQGLAFAKIRPGKEMKWLGYGPIPKPATMEHADITQQIEAWRFVLEQLANDFAGGRANVSPKEYPFTCAHCAQHLLCRLDIAAFTVDEEETEAADVE
jgi:ATP-dependent helicase/nuclease subunit B